VWNTCYLRLLLLLVSKLVSGLKLKKTIFNFANAAVLLVSSPQYVISNTASQFIHFVIVGLLMHFAAYTVT